MSSFTPLNEKGENFLNQRRPRGDNESDYSPMHSATREHANGEVTAAPALQLSLSPMRDAKNNYQEQIEKWLSRTAASKNGKGNANGGSEESSAGPERDAASHDISSVSPLQPKNPRSPSAGRQGRSPSDTSPLTGIQRGRRRSSDASSVKIDISHIGTHANSDGVMSGFFGKALGGVQNMLNFGTMKPTASFRAKAVSHARLRGTQLKKPLVRNLTDTYSCSHPFFHDRIAFDLDAV